MILTLGTGQSFDTEKDLSAAERHILQKLFLWKSMASSVEEFRGKKQDAFFKGWNDSGPVQESDAMKAISKDLEEKVTLRLTQEKGSGQAGMKETRPNAKADVPGETRQI